MREDRWDRVLREELKHETAHVGVSDFLKTRIDMEITARQEESTMNMRKRMHFKKFIAAAACVCLLVPAGIYAGGKVSSYTSGTNSADYKTSADWKDLDAMEKKAGIETDAVEGFSNGYRYTELSTVPFNAFDDAGNKMFGEIELEVTYQNAEGNILNCNMNRADERMEDDRTPDQTAEYGGITVNYYQETYKFVPADYEETDDDRALEAAGGYYISYGNDKVEVEESSSVRWEKDGVSYNIQGFDTDLTPAEMFSMAGEMIQGA